MKVLSIRQPFAHLIATGKKAIETRVWQTDYRGPLLIHASNKIHDGMLIVPTDNMLDFYNMDCKPFFDDLEPGPSTLTGYIIGVVDLVKCRPMNVFDERGAMCKMYPGAYAWELENPRLIEPIPLKGALRLWNYDGPIEYEVKYK